MNLNEYLGDESEKPLDRICTDGGFCGIFRKIGCVGDSLSSGEFETVDAEGNHRYYDLFDYSWGQYLAREAGCTVYNFSQGGMSAIKYCSSFAESKGYWDPELACQAYIISLGVNDLIYQNRVLGSVDDIPKNWKDTAPDNFAVWYAQIVSRLKEIEPDAKFFFVTMPKDSYGEENNALMEAHRALMYDMAKHFSNSYVIDLYTYAPPYDEEFKRKFFLNTHMNPAGYIMSAKFISSYIDYIIRHNFEDFKEIGLLSLKRK